MQLREVAVRRGFGDFRIEKVGDKERETENMKIVIVKQFLRMWVRKFHRWGGVFT